MWKEHLVHLCSSFIFCVYNILQQQVLRQPENVTEKDFKMQRTVTFDPQIIHRYEELICEWMNTIETILCDTSDER